MRAKIERLDEDERNWRARYGSDPKVADLYAKQRAALVAEIRGLGLPA